MGVEGTDAGSDVLEPPAGSAMPTEDTTEKEGKGAEEKAEEKADEKAGDDKKVVKLPASVKAPKPVTPGGSSRFQGRISELVSQRKEADARAAALEVTLQKFRGSSSDTPGVTPGKGVAKGAEGLNPDDYPTYGDYIKDLAKQTVAQEREAHQSQAAAASHARHQAERHQTFKGDAAPFEEAYGDGFWEAITDPSLPITEIMSDAVLELSDGLGPLTMLYLASHKDESAKICRMNPMAAVVQIGRIASRLHYEMEHGEAAPANIEGSAGDVQAEPAAVIAATQAPRRPSPTVVPILRGQTPADLSGEPSDKDDMKTWVQKEAARMRRTNPQARFYAG